MRDDIPTVPPFISLGRKGGWTDNELKLRRQVVGQNITILVLALGIAVMSFAVFYFAVLRQPDHYVLKVDERNRVSFGGYLKSRVEIKDEYIPVELVKYIENWRTVTPDNTMQKRNVTRLYCMIPADSAALISMNRYFNDPSNDPFQRNEQTSAITELRTVLQLSDRTWSIEWDETIRTHDGVIQGDATRYKANVLLGKGKVDPGCREANPLGLYVDQISWTNVL